ncbi:carbohydrate-binding family 9-like protein [Aquisphaera insulae]|uniref:carbohydrate-binding family 9-like protein n=1 Tax=Aquisphaera insulae TaxID=2712864 RepID=UPI00202E580C|nr:carbohydrate-binding family 9-like protein [Aquisphaera insulae]
MTRPFSRRIAPMLAIPAILAFFPIHAADEPSMATTHAVCRRASAPPVLDGKLDDPCWKDAAAIDKFASFWSRTPRRGTRAYLTWDDEALYWAGTMTDAEVRGFGERRNDHLWEGDVFELFLKPSANRPEYFEFQGNPRGLVFEMAFAERGKGPKDYHDGPALGTAIAVSVDGTLDHPGDTDRSWTIEGRIPWSAFTLAGGRPKPGDVWKFAICRYDYGAEGTEPVLMSSAPLTERSFHQHEDYGSLTFEGPVAAAR